MDLPLILSDKIRKLTRTLKRPLVFGFAGAALAAVFSLMLPNSYASVVRILPVESKMPMGLGGLASAAAAVGVNIPSNDGGDANYADILNSRWIRESLLTTRFDYTIKSWRFGPETTHSETLLDYLKAKDLDQGISRVPGILLVSRDVRSKLLTIRVETRSPQLSCLVARKTSALLETFVQGKGRTRGSYRAAFAEARLKDARGSMNYAEGELLAFLEKNRNFMTSLDPGVRLRGMRLENELKLQQQLVMTLALNHEQALMEEKNDVPILNILDEGSVPTQKSWPPRAMMVIMAFALGAVAAWSYENRKWIIGQISGTGENGVELSVPRLH